MKKILIVFVVFGLCCINTIYLHANNIDTVCPNSLEHNQFVKNDVSDYNSSIKELQEKLNDLRQSCDKQYSNYLTHVSLVVGLIGTFMALMGAFLPVVTNRASLKRIEDIKDEIEKKINDHATVLSSFEAKIAKNSNLLYEQMKKDRQKEFEKKRKLSLYFPIEEINENNNKSKELIDILVTDKSVMERIELLTSFLIKDPSNVYALNLRGLYYCDIFDYQKAKSDFEKAISINDSKADLYNNLGCVYNSIEKYEEAIKCFNTAIHLDEGFKLAYHNRGYSYRYLKEYDQAWRDCKKAIRLDDTFADAYNSLASICREKGNFEKALEFIFVSKGLDEENPWTYNGWAQLLIEQKRYSEAYGKSLKALKYDCRAELYDTCVDALLKMNSFEEASRMCIKGLEQKPDERIKSMLQKKLIECDKQLFEQYIINDNTYE